MSWNRRFARQGMVLLVALGAGAGAAPSVSHSTPAAPANRLALHFDVSAPARTITPPNRVPPLLRGATHHEVDRSSVPPGPHPSTGPAPDPVVQRTAGVVGAPDPAVSFDGMGDVDGYLPPDPNGAAGPHSYLQAVNDSIAEYDKTGKRVFGPVSVNSLWHGFGGDCATSGQGDPIVLYDRFADRWLVSDFAFGYDGDGNPVGPFSECVAVSRTGDPAGSWNRYAFLISDTKLPDYPKLGVWADGYYMTVNQFDPLTWNWEGVGVAAFDRSAMLAGDPDASMQYLDSPTSATSGLLPADLDGWTAPPAGAPEYLIGFDPQRYGGALALYRFAVDWADPNGSSFSGPFSIPTAAYNGALCGYARDCVPQPDTSVGLDASAYRLMYRLAYRNFGDHQSLVVTHTVDTDGSDHAGVRWYEIRDPGGHPAVFQQGTYAPDGDGRFNPSGAMDQSGDLAVGYSVSSSSTYPSIRYAGRLASDPAGQLPEGEGSIVAGGGSQLDVSHRWGDYSSMTVDPQDGCTFWYTNEYYRNTGGDWLTRIGAFRFPSCDGGASLSVDDVAVDEGATAQFTVSLSQAASRPVSVDYSTVTESAGTSDFTPTSGTLTFAPGQTTATISVPVSTDSVAEADETFSVLLSNPVNAGIDRADGTATINGVDQAARPDGVIKRAGAPFRGRNIYNLTGRLQTEVSVGSRSLVRRFRIGIRNTGPVAARFKVRGPGSSRWFHVDYYAGGRRVTKTVRAGRFTINVPAHRTKYLNLVVRPMRSAPRGAHTSLRILATAGGRRTSDAVRAVLRVR